MTRRFISIKNLDGEMIIDRNLIKYVLPTQSEILISEVYLEDGKIFKSTESSWEIYKKLIKQ